MSKFIFGVNGLGYMAKTDTKRLTDFRPPQPIYHFVKDIMQNIKSKLEINLKGVIN